MPRRSITLADDRRSRWSARRRRTSCSTRCSIATAIALSTQQPIVSVWNENFLWSAPSYFVGAGAAALARLDRRRVSGYWLAPLAAAPLYLTYRTYKVYLGRIEDEQRHVQRDVGPAPGDDRSAGARDRREGSDVADRTSAACSSTRPASRARSGMTENEIQGVKTAALLHDIGKLAVPEHILSKPGPLTQEEFQKIRIHPQVGAEIISGGAVPVSGRAADPQPPRALGRQGLSARARRARRFRSARASCRSSTTSTR